MARLERLVSMALAFSARRRMRGEELAREFGVSVRTVYRDVAALQQAGFPLVGTPGDGYQLVSGAHVRPLAVSPEEAEALVLAARLFATEVDDALRGHLASAVTKLEGTLAPEVITRLKRHRAAVRLPPSARGPGAPPNPSAAAPVSEEGIGPLSVFLDAIHTRRVVEIQYAGVARGDDTTRAVEPLGLVRTGAFWLVVAWCRLRGDVRVFRADRVRAHRVLDERFAPRPGATIEELTRVWVDGR